MNQVQESMSVFIEAWKMFAQRLPAGTFVRSQGVTAALCNNPLPFFNTCFSDTPLRGPEDLRARMRRAVELARDCPYPWFFCLCRDWGVHGWESIALEEGFGPEPMSLTGMLARQLKPPRRPPAELELRRVVDEHTARDIAEVNMHAYQMPQEVVEGLCNMHLWQADSYGYVGYRQGRPVTAAAAWPVAGTAYIGFVATHPDGQGKGLAETVMRHAVARCREETGLENSTLHATEVGRPLYTAMGYRSVAEFSFLTRASQVPD